MILQEEFARFCKLERTKLELNQKEFATRIGVSTKTISSIETRKKVKRQTLDQVANALGYDIVEIYKFVLKDEVDK